MTKPDAEAYRHALTALDVPAAEAICVGTGAMEELVGAAVFGFACVVQCNVFDRHNGLVDVSEQQRRARQGNVSMTPSTNWRASSSAGCEVRHRVVDGP